MKKANEVMDEFMNTWNNMMKYQDVKLNPVTPNYDEFERAFTEEKKIVAVVENVEEIPNSKLLEKKF